MGFLSVALSFDASAARSLPATHAAGAMVAFDEAPAPGTIVPSLAPAADRPLVVPVPVPVQLVSDPAQTSARVPEASTGRGPRVADKPRPPARTEKKGVVHRRVKLRPASSEDTALVKDAIGTRMTALGRCYERALLRTPGLSGKMKIRVEVGLDGRVTSAKVRRSTLRDKWLQGCVEHRVSGWRLPRLRDGSPVRVTIPVTFAR
jgi:TonB family protein